MFAVLLSCPQLLSYTMILKSLFLNREKRITLQEKPYEHPSCSFSGHRHFPHLFSQMLFARAEMRASISGLERTLASRAGSMPSGMGAAPGRGTVPGMAPVGITADPERLGLRFFFP